MWRCTPVTITLLDQDKLGLHSNPLSQKEIFVSRILKDSNSSCSTMIACCNLSVLGFLSQPYNQHLATPGSDSKMNTQREECRSQTPVLAPLLRMGSTDRLWCKALETLWQGLALYPVVRVTPFTVDSTKSLPKPLC